MSEILTHVDDDGIATITLNRPQKRNAVSYRMWEELATLFAAFGADSAVRTIVLTGASGCFSAGADISEFSESRAEGPSGDAYDAVGEACTRAIIETPQPTIAAVEGYCIGGGLGLAVCCDFRVASVDARFAIPAARLGIVYGWLDTRILMNVVGVVAAKRILFTARQLGAEEALALGLVDELVDEDAVKAARRMAAQFAANAPLSIRGAKRIVNALTWSEPEVETLSQRLSDEAKASDDYREGVLAFSEKRAPRFSGR